MTIYDKGLIRAMKQAYRDGGYVAGDGILYDDYSKQSGGIDYDPGTERVHMPHDGVKPEELNGPIICYKAGEKRVDAEVWPLEPCPCNDCVVRKRFAICFDMHFWGDDCPYECDAFEAWNRRVEYE